MQKATGDREQAVGNLRRALELYRDLGDRLGEAQALNHLGELLLALAGAAGARAHHEQALEIASSIGAPVEQAHALEGIGRSHLHDGHPGQAAPPLRQALAIYQQLGSAHAPGSKRSCATTTSRHLRDKSQPVARPPRTGIHHSAMPRTLGVQDR